MRKGLSKIIVTGGAGFIGSEFVRQAVKKGYKVAVIDSLTYAGDLERLKAVKGKIRFYKADICDKNKMYAIFNKERPECVVHFAAESHVDRSILDSSAFVRTNLQGTQILLDVSKALKVKRFLHLSTDEVYGDIEKGVFYETTPLNPSSPYSATKAAADLLVKSYVRTFQFPAIIVRPSNNYGPWQYPEKFIPRAIMSVLKNAKIPVYAKGANVREWLYVEDCARGIMAILEKGKLGEVYNLGSGHERKNIDIAKKILKVMGKRENFIQFVKDRPGHDLRYRLDSKKTHREIGWKPKINVEAGLKLTGAWCLVHKNWLFKKYSDVAKLYK